MTDNTPVRLTRGLARKVDGFLSVNRHQQAGNPPRPDEPGPRRATLGSPLGQGEVGSALMLGIGTVVQVYNPGRKVQGNVPLYWTAGNEVSTFNEDDPVRRGQWEVFVTPKPTTGTIPSSPVGALGEIDCDCNRIVIGQELDCDVCPCGNLYRWTYFPEISLPPASPEDPPTVWEDSGGLKRWRHVGGCLWVTPAFARPGCADLYRYELQLTAGTPPTGTLTLERISGDECPLVVATWCIATKGGCSFACFGVWQFSRTRPWSNLLPSTLACQLCVTPAHPNRRTTDGGTSSCACGITIRQPMRMTGPGTDIEAMEAHGFEDVDDFTKWLGWNNLWEMTNPTNVEIFGDGSYSATEPGDCNPKHVQVRGTNGAAGSPLPVIWAAALDIVELEDEMVSVSAIFTVHVESEETVFWTRTFTVVLTCAEWLAAGAAGQLAIPHVEDEDGEGTTEGPLTSPVTVRLDGTYPHQDEPTSSTDCGPPEEFCSEPCRVRVIEDGTGGPRFFQVINRTGCDSTDCTCQGFLFIGCQVAFIEGIGFAQNFAVDDEFDVPCAVGPQGELTCTTAETLTATGDAGAFDLLPGDPGEWGGAGELDCGGAVPVVISLICAGGCYYATFYFPGEDVVRSGHVTVVSADPLDATIYFPAVGACPAFSIHVVE